MTGYLLQALIYLGAATIAVPLARLLGLGSVLGYLVAGVVIGPLSGLVGSETETLQHFAEFGVVMMLFLVGLELEPKLMWSMRRRLIGLGGLQVALTAIAIAAVAYLTGMDWRTAAALGMILALSSTAIVLQTYDEKGLARTEGGRAGFSVLLFQDMAVIPIIALLPLLALPEFQSRVGDPAGHTDLNLVANLSGWSYGLVVIASVALVVMVGHYLSGPLFRFVAASGLREAFTTTALALVIGIAALMGLVGLSPALGTFLAGMVLANSEFRHELEANIEPFKGLLLGLFFMTVGAGIRFDLLFGNLALVVSLTLGVMLLKGLILFGLALTANLRRTDGWLFALSLAQAGEFGFVLLSFSQQNGVLGGELAQLLALVIALSMFLTPVLFIAFDKLIVPRYQGGTERREPDDIDDQGQVIIAGVGRFGQIVNRLLTANGVPTIVLDRHVGQIERMSRVQMKTYFGDASRPDLLQTAGIENASLLVIAIDDRERAVEVTRYVKHAYPNVCIMARAYDRGHQYLLREAGADYIVNETYYSALQLGGEALARLGFHPFMAQRRRAAFDWVEERSRDKLYEAWQQRSADDAFGESYVNLFMQVEQILGEAMRKSRDDRHARVERGWTPPPKNYLDDFPKG